MTDDDVSEDTEFFGFKISNVQNGELRNKATEEVADVGLLDDDARGVTVDPTSISLNEPASGETGAASSYTVKLNSKPTDTVTVTVGGANPAVTLSGATLSSTSTLTFTATNWDTAQTVTVTPVEDANGTTETITLTHIQSGGDYTGIAADSVTVNVTDSDTRSVVLSPTSLTATEGDATGDSYTVKLSTQPSGTVTVTIGGHSSTDLTISGTALTGSTLTFTASNWNTAQTVTVKAAHDDNAGDESETLTHTATGGDYANVTKDILVTVTDDDTVAIVLSESALTVTEGDETGVSYTVKLSTEPSETVTLTIGGHSGTDLSISGTALTGNTLTFTASNWDTAQTVTVKAAHDANAADESETLTHTASCGDYATVTKDLPVTVTDDETAAIVLDPVSLTVEEGNTIGTSYTVKLSHAPTGDVAVTIGGHSGTDLTISGNALTFTDSNWDTAQTVTVKAGEDANAGDESETLTHTASGGDYATVTKDLPVTVTDDDTANIVLSESALTVTEGDNTGDSYTVKLSTQPSDTVTVTIGGHSGTDLSISGTALTGNTLTITASNWNTAQTVTVKAGEDANAGDESETLTHTASGGDYATVTKDLPVTVTDDAPETVTVSFGAASYTLIEGSSHGQPRRRPRAHGDHPHRDRRRGRSVRLRLLGRARGRHVRGRRDGEDLRHLRHRGQPRGVRREGQALLRHASGRRNGGHTRRGHRLHPRQDPGPGPAHSADREQRRPAGRRYG